jgi:hypothetical protein
MRPIAPILLLFLLPVTTHAENWPQWRGPHLNGHSSETNLPTTWSPTENILWKTPIPGTGHSSPIVFNDRVFVTTAIEKEQLRQLLCLDRDSGKILWQRDVLKAPLERKHTLNNFASSTPATDGRYVFCAFLEMQAVHLSCYDFDGNLIWRKSPGHFKSMHGWASAPILHNDLVILNCDQDAQACLVAYDRNTGEERWRTDRPNRTRSYCNPLIVEAAGKTQMILTGSKSTASYNPDTGEQYWLFDGPTEQFVASPVLADGVVFITGGFPTYHYVGLDPAGSGNITKTDHVLYHEKKGAYVPSPIAVGNHVYMVSDQPRHEGELCCIEAKTGKRLWTHQLGKHHRPSPVYADGLLYFLDDEGTTHVLRASPAAFEAVAKNELKEKCFASPAISQGRVFIRTVESLYCVGSSRRD